MRVYDTKENLVSEICPSPPNRKKNTVFQELDAIRISGEGRRGKEEREGEKELLRFCPQKEGSRNNACQISHHRHIYKIVTKQYVIQNVNITSELTRISVLYFTFLATYV
jgi:hypothetical protein